MRSRKRVPRFPPQRRDEAVYDRLHAEERGFFLREINHIDYVHLALSAPTQEVLDAYKKQEVRFVMPAEQAPKPGQTQPTSAPQPRPFPENRVIRDGGAATRATPAKT